MKEKGNVYGSSVGKPGGDRPLGRLDVDGGLIKTGQETE